MKDFGLSPQLFPSRDKLCNYTCIQSQLPNQISFIDYLSTIDGAVGDMNVTQNVTFDNKKLKRDLFPEIYRSDIDSWSLTYLHLNDILA